MDLNLFLRIDEDVESLDRSGYKGPRRQSLRQLCNTWGKRAMEAYLVYRYGEHMVGVTSCIHRR